MPTIKLKIDLTDLRKPDTKKFLNLFNDATWDMLKKRLQEPEKGLSDRKAKIAQAKQKAGVLFGGPVEVPRETVEGIVKAVLEK